MTPVADLTIVWIEAAASLIFLTAFYYIFRLFQKTKSKTDIWLLVSIAVFIAFLMSGANAMEWFYDENPALDETGEILSIMFSLIWMYITYRFISLKYTDKTPEK